MENLLMYKDVIFLCVKATDGTCKQTGKILQEPFNFFVTFIYVTLNLTYDPELRS